MGFEDYTAKLIATSPFQNPYARTNTDIQEMLKLVDFSNPLKLNLPTNSNELFSTQPLAVGDITQFSFATPPGFDFSLNMPAMPSLNNMTTINNLISNFNQDTNNKVSKLLEMFNAAIQNTETNPETETETETETKTETANNKTKNTVSGYGNFSHKITTLYKGSAADLNKELKGVLANKGAKFLELQNKYGISASVLAAIAINESGNGTSNAARTKNNVCGIMSAESKWKKLATFNSVDECLEAMAKNLKKNYVDKGLVTISQIHKKYCPIGAENDPTGLNKNWSKGVASITAKFENAA